MTGQEIKRTRAPRRDAQQRREALIVAAAACFAADGYGVPLEVIAERAGVGRGTLYRNFPDREALALAIFAREVDRLEATIDPTVPIVDTITALIREGAPAMSLFARIAAELQLNDANLAALRSVGERLDQIVAPVVRQARARGEIDERVTSRDIVLAIRMVGGLPMPFMSQDEITDQVRAALSLLSEGLRPR